MPHHSLELVDIVRQLAQHQAAMVRELAALRAQLEVPHATREEAALLLAIDMAMGDRSFVAAELMAVALGGGPAAVVLGAHVAGMSVKSLGKRLAAVAGKPSAAGLVLQRLGASSEGVVWGLSKSQTPAD